MIPNLSHTIHFIGIGGIGMSALAFMMRKIGYRVQGSDNSAVHNKNVDRLSVLNIPVFSSHKEEHVDQATFIIKSSAIRADNPELRAAQAKGLPILTRGKALASFMEGKRCITVAGTNGKTTTTALIGHILDYAGLDPTIISGGIMQAYKNNVRLGLSPWMVVESDESDGSFLELPTDIGLITNVESEHLDYYGGSFEDQKKAFATFARQCREKALLCFECPTTRHLMQQEKDKKHTLFYGFDPSLAWYAKNICYTQGYQTFDIVCALGTFPVRLPLFGQHNVLNALAAIGAVFQAGITDVSILQKALESFPGVERRFTLRGTWNNISVYDDYGHHPTSIAFVLSAAKKMTKGRVIAVFQPHRFTRMRDLFQDFISCFKEADAVVVLDIYSAGETPIEHIHAEIFCHHLKKEFPQESIYLPQIEHLAPLLVSLAQPGDFIIFFGASNNLSQWAQDMPALLEDSFQQEPRANLSP